MIDTKVENRLQQIARREGRSLLQYANEAFPWTTADEKAALAELGNLIGEERDAVGRLVELLARRGHTYPYLGSYPTTFTSVNFVSLEHLLPMLVDYEARSLGEMECDLPEMTDPEALAVVQEMVDMKQRHLELLKRMTACHPDNLSTVR
jgi:hypothetical protein